METYIQIAKITIAIVVVVSVLIVLHRTGRNDPYYHCEYYKEKECPLNHGGRCTFPECDVLERCKTDKKLSEGMERDLLFGRDLSALSNEAIHRLLSSGDITLSEFLIEYRRRSSPKESDLFDGIDFNNDNSRLKFGEVERDTLQGFHAEKIIVDDIKNELPFSTEDPEKYLLEALKHTNVAAKRGIDLKSIVVGLDFAIEHYALLKKNSSEYSVDKSGLDFTHLDCGKAGTIDVKIDPTKPIEWAPFSINSDHVTRPDNIAYKIPMQREVVTFDGRVFQYHFIGSIIQWQYLCSTVPDSALCYGQNKRRFNVRLNKYWSLVNLDIKNIKVVDLPQS